MFVFKQWDEFCKKLIKEGYNSVTASSLLNNEDKEKTFLILKHDVETNVSKALKLAKIESKYYHKGSYYVQAYLLKDDKNINILKKIRDLGHEVSYHYDVMDNNKGDIGKAKIEFEKNVKLFEDNGFQIKTVCQHGNPVIVRKGYRSNRDFFRNQQIKNNFSNITDIMVDYKNQIKLDYKYISDAGYRWKEVYDPENNDIIESSDKNNLLNHLDDVIVYLKQNNNVIISTHPHRWQNNKLQAILKDLFFRLTKGVAKILLMIPGMKKVMGRFYYLAKKI